MSCYRWSRRPTTARTSSRRCWRGSLTCSRATSWLATCRVAGFSSAGRRLCPAEEDGGGRWSVDHLFFDQDAVPTLVEVKRSSDTRIRREVIGQMLDYAANAVVYWPIETLRTVFERRCEQEGREADTELAAVLEVGGDADTSGARPERTSRPAGSGLCLSPTRSRASSAAWSSS